MKLQSKTPCTEFLEVSGFDKDGDFLIYSSDGNAVFLDRDQVKDLINHLQTQVWQLESQNAKENV